MSLSTLPLTVGDIAAAATTADGGVGNVGDDGGKEGGSREGLIRDSFEPNGMHTQGRSISLIT